MPHANAPLTELGRLRLARCVVDDHWPLRRAAERFQVAVTTAHRWADRYRHHDPTGTTDHNSRPHTSPHRHRTPDYQDPSATPMGTARNGYLPGQHPSTVHRVLTRYRMPRLARLDRATAAPIRRHEHPAPSDLVHVDIKKLGTIPDGMDTRGVPAPVVDPIIHAGASGKTAW